MHLKVGRGGVLAFPSADYLFSFPFVLFSHSFAYELGSAALACCAEPQNSPDVHILQRSIAWVFKDHHVVALCAYELERPFPVEVALALFPNARD